MTLANGFTYSESYLARSSAGEKQSQIKRLRDFQARHADSAAPLLARVEQIVIDNGKVFAVPGDAVRACSLDRIGAALYVVGGQCRHSMWPAGSGQ